MNLKFVLFTICVSLFFASCGSKKKIIQSTQKQPTVSVTETNLPTKTIEENTKHSSEDFLTILEKENPTLNKKTVEYIRKFYPIAVLEMHTYKIPASITLAQGILESGNGFSDLATRSNNHFGIKCHRGWTGEKVYHDDDEKGECFRKYQHPDTSYKDHSKFLAGRKRYANLFTLHKTDYANWAKGLKKAGYATDKKYPQKLINLIENYQLYNFDTIETNGTPALKYSKNIKNTTSNYYKVKQGDTLYSIAKNHNITVKKLKKINGLTDNTISIGQHLLVN